MKKTSLLLVALLFVSQLFAEGPKIKVTLHPKISKRFLAWEAVPGATGYSVQLMQKTSLPGQPDAFRAIKTVRSNSNYTRFDEQTVNSDVYYEVTAVNSNGPVGSSDPQKMCWPPCGNVNTICYKQCVGRRYAYRINVNVYGNEQTGDGYLELTDAYDYYDEVHHVNVPFYEAMTHDMYILRCSAANDPYHYYAMRPMFHEYHGQGVGQTVYDASGNGLNNMEVYFVAKTPEDFQGHVDYGIFESYPTKDFGISGNECDPQVHVVDLVNIWNMHLSATTHADPQTLECNGVDGGEEGSGSPEGNEYEELPETIFCLAVGETAEEIYEQLEDCLEGEGGGFTGGGVTVGAVLGGISASLNIGVSGKPVVKRLFLQRLDKLSRETYFDYSDLYDKRGNYKAPKVALESGLYRATYILKSGKAISTYFEHDALTQKAKTNADLTTLVVAPNPIQNNNLHFTMTAERKMKASLRVLSLSGKVVYTEQIELEKNHTESRNVLLLPILYPYNQVRVQMLFDDGSVLEKTAIRP